MINSVILENLLLLTIFTQSLSLADLKRTWNIEQGLRRSAHTSVENRFN
jgi:hypothetical protein